MLVDGKWEMVGGVVWTLGLGEMREGGDVGELESRSAEVEC